MWTRAALKSQAKKYLKDHYLYAFLISLVLMIVGGNTSGGQSIFKYTVDRGEGSWGAVMTGFAVFIALFAAVFTIAIILLAIFVGNPLEVGGRRYFVKATQGGESDLAYLTSVFGTESYLNVVKVMFLKKLFVFLWFFALIIPGIIKLYAYSMVPYILAEEPDMPYKEALMLSEDMTYTHKFNMFVLDLSFIGWFILGGLFFGIGHIFVNPYVDATKAYLYQELKAQAQADGFY